MISQPASSDFDELIQVWEASVRSTHHFLTEEDIQYFKPLVRNQYFPAVALFVVRNEKKRIAAFIGLSDECIEMLFVHPDDQGKGYGKLLIDFAVNEKQICKVDVNEQNEKAFLFYRKRGFDVTGRDATDSSGKPFPILHMAIVPAFTKLLLSKRFHMEDIHSLLYVIKYNEQRRDELYNLIYDKDDSTSYLALWVCTHLPMSDREWLQTKQEDLINAVMICPHNGKRRIFLQLLEKQTFADTPRVDFLDFCLDRMFSNQEPVGVQSLCIKLAYKLCQSIPELMQELRTILEMQKGELLSPALRSSRRNILKAIHQK